MKINKIFLIDYVFILFISFWPVIHFISNNLRDNIISSEIVFFGLIVFLFFSVLYFLLSSILKKKKTKVLGFVISIMIPFFLFGGFEELVIGIRGTLEYSAKISLILQIITTFLIYSFFQRRMNDSNRNSILTVLISILWFFPIINIPFNISSSKKFFEEKKEISSYDIVLNSNIYYIILDQYAREDVLKKYLNFDNSYFLNELQKRGFKYFPKSFSNFDTTPLSISTTLNMGFYTFTPDYNVSIIQNESRILDILKSNGYKNIFIESGGNSQITCNGLEDFCIKSGTINDDIALLLKMTPLWRIIRSSTFFRYFEALYILTDLKPSIIKTLDFNQGNKFNYFVMAHIMSPHEPQRYNEDCSKYYSINPGLGEPSVSQYLTDLPCLNQNVIESIDQILKRDKSNPIIFLISDHGISRSMVNNNDELLRLKNLMLIKSPNQCSEYLNQKISPVNIMHFAVSCITQEKMKFNKNRYFVTIKNSPKNKKDLIEVTEKVESERKNNE